VVINSREKKLLNDAINSLTNQLNIINNSIPGLVRNIGFYKKIGIQEAPRGREPPKLVKLKYGPIQKPQEISLTITEDEKKDFLKNLSRSNLSINQLKKKFAVKKVTLPEFGKPNAYAKISNQFFRGLSNRLVSSGYFGNLNRNLRLMNSPFVLGTYVSMILFTSLMAFFFSIVVLVFLSFYEISPLVPFFSLSEQPFILRFAKYIWVVIVIPVLAGFLLYFYPSSEAGNLAKKIEQELPFVSIHMSAVATSGVEPISIFRIILKSEEYRYSNIMFRKLMNFINFHGKDLVSALKETSRTCPSSKLKVMLDGLATTVTSGGSLHKFLEKHSETLLFDYRLEREKYTRAAETFMDIYISIVIAAPMILLMLFVIMGSTGALIGSLGLSVGQLNILIIMAIVFLNIGFLVFLTLKQPNY
jgi:Flp pilus assembly protein TadB